MKAKVPSHCLAALAQFVSFTHPKKGREGKRKISYRNAIHKILEWFELKETFKLISFH